jgi:hypothetical protein
MGGSRYFVIFVDDYSRYTWLYLLQNRSKLPKIYFKFQKIVQTHFSRNIKFFRSNNAMEYLESSFLATLKQNGTLSHRSCPGTSQQNGRAERKHRHILDTVRALLLFASIPEHFWGEAALIAIYTINRVPSPTTFNKSPYELLYGSPSDYQSLRVFGCVCFVLLQPHERTKLEPRSRICCFLGYGIEHKGYRCYDPIAKRLRISRHFTFWEHRLFSDMESFSPSPPCSSPIFTDLSFNLFPESTDLDAGMTSSPDDSLTDGSDTPDPPVDPSTTPPEPELSSPRRSTRVKALLIFMIIIVTLPLLLYTNLTPFVRLVLILFGSKLCLKNLLPLPKLILGT